MGLTEQRNEARASDETESGDTAATSPGKAFDDTGPVNSMGLGD